MRRDSERKRRSARALIAVACLAFWNWSGVEAPAQALPNLAANLESNGGVSVTWPVPTVDFILQETASLADPKGWHASPLAITTSNCSCVVSLPGNVPGRYYRLASTNPPPIGIYLGPATNLFTEGQLGMKGVPDMHTAVMRQSNGSYRVWIAGQIDNSGGATGLLLTTNLLTYSPGYGSATNAWPVFLPSCRDATYSNNCVTNFDSHYAGADLVFRATNGTDLLMVYHGGTVYYGTSTNEGNGWAEVGLARSSDEGITWGNRQAIITSSDQKPDRSPTASAVSGVVEPGAIVAGGFIYTYYAYFPTKPLTNPAPPSIEVARAEVAGDAAPETWFKYYTNGFTQPGLGGLGMPVVASVCACTRQAQPWPVFSTYLNAYVLIFLCDEGWFFSTSTNLVNWAAPTQFFTAPTPEFSQNQPTDENVILVTPGNPDQVIGQTGYVLYAHTPAWGKIPHELWMRPFTFRRSP